MYNQDVSEWATVYFFRTTEEHSGRLFKLTLLLRARQTLNDYITGCTQKKQLVNDVNLRTSLTSPYLYVTLFFNILLFTWIEISTCWCCSYFDHLCYSLTCISDYFRSGMSHGSRLNMTLSLMGKKEMQPSLKWRKNTVWKPLYETLTRSTVQTGGWWTALAHIPQGKLTHALDPSQT